MKPFNLEEALAGKPVVTRGGKKVSELYLFKTCVSDYPLIAIVDGVRNSFTKNGRSLPNSEECSLDLFMASEKVTQWLNVYKGNSVPFITSIATFDTQEEALSTSIENQYVATVPITFEI